MQMNDLLQRGQTFSITEDSRVNLPAFCSIEKMNNNELQFIFAISPESKKYCSESRQVFWLTFFLRPSHPDAIGAVAGSSKSLY